MTATLIRALGATLLAAGCATAVPPFPSEPKSGTVFHGLHTPPGSGPFPAVVLLHTCGVSRAVTRRDGRTSS